MKFRKFISILLAFVMVVMTLGLTPAAALADAPAVGSEENLQPDTSGEPEQSGESGEEIGLEHEHEWEKVDSESFDATCEEEGKTVYKCNVSGCEEQYEEYTYPLGHDFVDGVCRRCGAEEGVITADTWGALKKAFSRGGEVTVALSGNIEAGEGDKALTVPKDANVTLQLNGYTIDRGLTETASVMNGNVIIVLGELTVDGEGIITGGSTKGAGGGIWIRKGGKLTLNGGTVKGNYTQNTGGGVYLSGEGSCFTMTGGSITENKARNGGGAAIDNSGDIVISGGSITGNTATISGGGVWFGGDLDRTSLTVSGGSITGNTANEKGGGVYINGSGRFSYAVGSITGNTAPADADIAYKNCLINYNVTVDETQNGTVSADWPQARAGDTVTLTAIPSDDQDYGCRLMSLTVTAGNEFVPVVPSEDDDTIFTFTMPAADVTVSADFAPLYKIETDVLLHDEQFPGLTDHGCTLEADKEYAAAGETVILTLHMEPGYKFEGISIYGNDTQVVSIDNTTYSFVVPEDDYFIITAEAFIEAATYSLTSDNSGSISGVLFQPEDEWAPEHSYYSIEYDTLIKVMWMRTSDDELKSMSYSYFENGKRITTEIYFEFDDESGWYEGSFRMPNGDTTVHLDFNKQHGIEESSVHFGEGLVVSDKNRAFAGETITLRAIPDELYVLKAWHVTYEDEDGNEVPVEVAAAAEASTHYPNESAGTFTMPGADVTFWAEFERAFYAIDIGDFIPHGKLTSEPSGYAKAGSIVTLTASPDEDYEPTVKVWYGDTTVECTPENNTTWTFTMPSADVKADAVYSPANSWEALQSALNDGGTIILKYSYIADDENHCLRIPEGKVVTLDLNGQNIDGSDLIDRDVLRIDGSLTLKDSAGGGEIIGSDMDDTVYVSYGNLNMEGGTISSEYCTYGAVFVGGFSEYCTMSGGTLSAANGEVVLTSAGNIEISGGTVSGSNCSNIVDAQYGSIEIRGGIFERTGTSGEDDNRGIVLGSSLLIVSGSFTFDFKDGPDVFMFPTSLIKAEDDLAATFTVDMDLAGVFAEAVDGPLKQTVLDHMMPYNESFRTRLNDDGKAEMYPRKTITEWAQLAAAMYCGGDYILGADVYAGTDSNSLFVPSGAAVTLDLNGHIADCTKLATTLPIIINGKLTLSDSDGGGCIRAVGGDFDSLVYVEAGTFTMNSGILQAADIKYIVYVCGGAEFVMNDGEIEDDDCSASVILCDNADFTMNGGTVYGSSDRFGSVYADYGSRFTMNGGLVSGSGDQWVIKAGGDVEISGGKVESRYGRCALRVTANDETHGTATLTGGEFIGSSNGYSALSVDSTAVLNLSGAPKITGRLADIYLAENVVIGIKGELTYDGKYAMDSPLDAVFAQGENYTLTESDRSRFGSEGYEVILQNNTLVLKQLPSNWHLLKEMIAGAPDGGTVKLESDYTANGADTPLDINKNVTLDLNGHTIDGSDLKTYVVKQNNGTLTVKDSGNGGEIRGKGGSYTVKVEKGSLTLESGTISGGDTHFGVVYICENCSFTMNGGSVIVNGYERAVTVLRSFTMTGGIIEGRGSSYSLVCIYKDVNFTMSGGSVVCAEGSNITHGVLLEYADMKISGNVSIAPHIYLKCVQINPFEEKFLGKILVSGELTNEQPIPVKLKREWFSRETEYGVFAVGGNGYALTDDLLTHFTSANPAYGIRLNGSGEGELYERQRYTVTFDRGEGTGEMEAGTAYEGVPFILPSCDFNEPEGKTFKEWSVKIGDAAAVSKQPDDEIDVTADATVTAVWETAPKFATMNLVLSGKIGLSFNMTLPEIDGVDYSTSYMTFEIDHGSVTERVDYGMSGKKAGEKQAFVAYVNSVQMAEPVTATFHYQQGEEWKTIEKTYSVANYFDSFETNMDSYDQTTQDLVKAVADYGHYVQPFLANSRHWTLGTDYAVMEKHYTDNYSISDILASTPVINKNNNTAGDITDITYSLTLDSDTAINVYFRPGADYRGTFYASVDDGEEQQIERSSDERYCVRIEDISAHRLSKNHTITVSTADGHTAAVTVSALCYVHSALTSFTSDQVAQNAVASIYAYSQAADAFKREHP